LHDIRKSKVWQEAREEGETLANTQIVRKCLAKGMTVKETAEFVEITVKEVRRLAKDEAK